MRRAHASGAALSAAAAALVAAALFLGHGSSNSRLFWVGAFALLLAAVAVALRPPSLPGPGVAFFAFLIGLVVWQALSISWSIEPDRSWDYANRGIVYLAFAAVGATLGGVPRARIAAGLAALLGTMLVLALAAKVVPALYGDYGRLARLRYPLAYWNELALLAALAVPLGLWLAGRRAAPLAARVGGTLLVYAAFVCVVLTYSRFGIVLAVLGALAWTAIDRERLDSLPALVVAAPAAAVVSVAGLLLPGIGDDGQPHAVRVHDGSVFGLVLLGVAALVAAASRWALPRRTAPVSLRRFVLAAAVLVVLVCIAALAALVVRAGGPADFVRARWHEFANTQSVSSRGRLGSASSGNRWTWWQEAWRAFTHHPGGGTGAGTFGLTSIVQGRNSQLSTVEPHNTPLQFLSETGIVGFLLYIGMIAAAALAVLRGPRDRATAALALAALLALLHSILDIDWDYVATQGPLFLVAGALVARPAEAVPRRRPLVAAAAIACCLAALYSLLAPFLSGRRLQDAYEALGSADLAGARAAAQDARSLDPLALEPLYVLAGTELEPKARQLYEKATRLEPTNPDPWYQLGAFELSRRHWRAAYAALNRSYALDAFGPLGHRGSLLDQARCKVDPSTCPRRAPGAHP
jgi:hypothetical protein